MSHALVLTMHFQSIIHVLCVQGCITAMFDLDCALCASTAVQTCIPQTWRIHDAVVTGTVSQTINLLGIGHASKLTRSVSFTVDMRHLRHFHLLTCPISTAMIPCFCFPHSNSYHQVPTEPKCKLRQLGSTRATLACHIALMLRISTR